MPLFIALHRALGQPPGPFTNEMIDAAVAANLPEADDLDWKSGAPAQRKFEDDNFPKDVAALANVGGGVIVYGVVAKGKKATSRNDAGESTDPHERALVTATCTIRPPVLKLEFIEVGEEPTRAIVVVVPGSTEGPHLIFRTSSSRPRSARERPPSG